MTIPPDNARPAPTPWGLIILLGAMTGFAPVSIDMYLPALPSIGKTLGASAGATQATLSAFLAGMAIGQFIYGPASDRFGRRAPVMVGAVVYMAASVLCALAPSIEWLIAGRFLQALGGCAGAVIARAVVRDRFGHTDTARVLSLLMLIMGLAPILTPLAGGWVMLVAGWRGIFWLLAGFGVAICVAVMLFLTESRSDETAALARSENPFRAYAELLRQRRLIGYSLAGALNGAVLFTYISGSPDLIIDQYGFSPQTFGWVFGVNAFGVIGASQVNRWLLRRHHPDYVLGRASLVASGFAILMFADAATGLGGMWLLLPLLFMTLASYGLMQGNTMAGALSVDPRRAGSISALMGGMSFGVGAFASWASGAFHDGTARPMTGVMLVALLGSAAAIWLLALPRDQAGD
ncbi:DHA1 family bicyclomycin/chloramphenicol resistance-like MFS transporter [Caulobacter ginsengisoli]|uniref:Bcr/CflA family efflux transporter n=1 Tax=Caulobacter ginsengisoli TaxID=400775 RepID=A0ABU0IJY5_9CAUL|nr:multidrug effflux MFS transporter [Caulobacter ginsengisoli]MDQ0462320.1 DHA1 family bicyclomycin/chloramphenicol resistance-like MFS transporter [Caulobacter ginsengisoli]